MTTNEARGGGEAPDGVLGHLYTGRNVMDTTGVGKRLPPAPNQGEYDMSMEDLDQAVKARKVAYDKYMAARITLNELQDAGESSEEDNDKVRHLGKFLDQAMRNVVRVTEKQLARGDNIMRLAKARYVAYVKYAEAADWLESFPPGASSLEVTESTDELVTSYRRLKEAAENLDWVSGGNASPDWTLSPEDELKRMDVK